MLRPGVAPGIALDLLLLRAAAPLVQRARGLNTDLVALVDEWGGRFVDELDYCKEAAAGEAFLEAVRSRGLGGTITAAEPVRALCTRRVLTTAWVDGDRLDALPGGGGADGAEAKRLVSLALVAYLRRAGARGWVAGQAALFRCTFGSFPVRAFFFFV